MKHLLIALFACVMAVGQSVFPPSATSVSPAGVTGARICTISSSSATAYVGATSPAMSTYPAGVEVRFTANQTSGAAPTLNCGGGALAIRDALASAAIPTGFMESGYVYTVRSNGTYWLMQEPAPGAAGQKFLSNVSVGTTFLGPPTGVAATDTATIQAAIDSVANGTRIMLAPGTYSVTALTINKSITLEGVNPGGYNSTSLNAFTVGTTIACESTTADCITVALPASNTLGGVEISNLQIRGNRNVADVASGSCIKFAGGNNSTSIRDWTLRNLYIRDCQEYGIEIVGNVFEGQILNVRSHNAVLDGLYTVANGGLGPAVINLIGYNAQINDRYGMNIAGGGTGITCAGCYISANAQDGAQTTGVVSFIGGYFEGNGLSTSNTYDNIVAVSGSLSFNGTQFAGNNVSRYNARGASGSSTMFGFGNYYGGAATADLRFDSGISAATVTKAMSTSGTFVSNAASAGVVQRLDLVNFGDGKIIVATGQIFGWSDAMFNREGAGQIGTNGGAFNAASLYENSVRAVTKPTAPSAATDACVANQVTFDASFAYFCSASGAWKRVAIAAW